MKIIVFDTETTGLPESRGASIYETTKWPHIVQISWILYDVAAGEILSTQDHIIHMGNIPIPPESITFHGISKQRSWRKGIPLSDAMDLFDKDLIKADLIVAHNVLFDKRVYMVEAIRAHRSQYFTTNDVRKPEYCTMLRTKDFCGIERTSLSGNKYNKYPTLSELHDTLYNFIPAGAHDSMADVLICLRCYMQHVHNIDVLKDHPKIGKTYELYCGAYK